MFFSSIFPDEASGFCHTEIMRRNFPKAWFIVFLPSSSPSASTSWMSLMHSSENLWSNFSLMSSGRAISAPHTASTWAIKLGSSTFWIWHCTKLETCWHSAILFFNALVSFARACDKESSNVFACPEQGKIIGASEASNGWILSSPVLSHEGFW